MGRFAQYPISRAWGLTVAGLLGFAVSVSTVQAASPGFDCNANRLTPMEQMICADGGLALLDAALSDRFGAVRRKADADTAKILVKEQRDWLKQRDAACPVPALAADESPTFDELWRSAPCIAGQYRQRIAELGGDALATADLDRDEIHPACIAAAMLGGADSSPRPVPMTRCAKGSAHIPVLRENGGTAFEGTPNGGVSPSWFSYRFVGNLAGGRKAFLVDYSMGGTGNFSDVIMVQRRGRSDGDADLLVETVWPGGDRCNGGIVEATADRKGLQVVSRVTPLRLMELAGSTKINADAASLPVDCAICCIGTVTYQSMVGREEDPTMLGVTLEAEMDLEELAADGEPANRCLAKAVQSSVGKLPKALSSADLGRLAKAYDGCLARTRR